MLVQELHKNSAIVVRWGKDESGTRRVVLVTVSFTRLGFRKLSANTPGMRRFKCKGLRIRHNVPANGDLRKAWVVVVVDEADRFTFRFKVLVLFRTACKPIPLDSAGNVLDDLAALWFNRAGSEAWGLVLPIFIIAVLFIQCIF